VTYRPAFLRSPFVLLAALALPALVVAACSSKSSGGSASASTMSGSGGAGNSTGTALGGMLFGDGSIPDSPVCGYHCSADRHQVLDCNNKVIATCMGSMACDLGNAGCSDACTAASDNKSSVGCDYYATHLEMDYSDQCFAVYLANTWNSPAHLQVGFNNYVLPPVSMFGMIPSGTGANITYTPYDDTNGLMPGEVVILFLSGTTGSTVPCPVVKTAVPMGSMVQGTGLGHSFHITSDVPVVAYQISPFGGGSAAITGASLLLPTSAWDTNYFAVTAAPYSSVTLDNPSFNIIGWQDGTMVTMLPSQGIMGGGAGTNSLPAGPANMPYTFALKAGQMAQFSQQADLSGTVIQSNNPIGFMASNACMQRPAGTAFCDHGEQMLPPVKALGNEYAAVMFRPRVMGDKAIWRLVGTIDGTTLTYSSNVGGPATLKAGQTVEFQTDQPFTVQSQDTAHPFMLFAQMTGSQWSGLSDMGGYGDPDFVLGVPPQQFLDDYVFFTDPTYPETNLVVVRAKDKASNMFQDVTLDCLSGPLTGWMPVGNYEWTRIDLTTGDFKDVGSCSTGRHEMKSTGTFGLWVWGWGSPLTTIFTKNVSYGYPGGMNVASINGVVIVTH
jgi:hypothetical protein